MLFMYYHYYTTIACDKKSEFYLVTNKEESDAE